MGIFDDAIRQHLELKRHQGAEESELKQLEDEAFGPPARPGDPEFGEKPAEGDDEPAADAQEATEDGTSAVEADSGVESLAAPEPAGDAPPEPEDFQPEQDPEPELEAEPEPEPLPELEEEEQEQEPTEPESDEATFSTAEREAIAQQPTTFFEQQTPASEAPLELDDLDLDLEEELDEVGALEPESADADESGELEAEEAEPEDPDDLRLEDEPEPDSETDLAEAPEIDEDVLEETPEFLRDNPDDDELWFEQGKPKDFDF